MTTDGARAPEPTRPQQATRMRLRVLWAGAAVYLLIILNATQYVGVLPYQVVILAGVINFAILFALILTIRNVYRRTGFWRPF